jgi:SAM-dependent methyltransferase
VAATTSDALRLQAAAYYEGKLRAHGPTARGVDWNSESSQRLRFDQLLRIVLPGEDGPASLNDYGCGYGALADHLRERHPSWAYCGFDVSPTMIETAAALHGGEADRVFTSDAGRLRRATYTVASGIFNVKFETPDAVWTEYVLETLDTLAGLSDVGFAFNVLTGYAAAEYRRDDLYYADATALFEHCRRRFSPRVALLHDYPLFEFTMLVRI